MARQSITLTPPNDQWLEAQVKSQEYASKSEALTLPALSGEGSWIAPKTFLLQHAFPR